MKLSIECYLRHSRKRVPQGLIRNTTPVSYVTVFHTKAAKAEEDALSAPEPFVLLPHPSRSEPELDAPLLSDPPIAAYPANPAGHHQVTAEVTR